MYKIQRWLNYGVQNTKNRETIEKYSEIKDFPYLSKEENEKRQLIKLNTLLNHAYNKVPYYNKTLQECDIVKNGKIAIKDLSELEKIPFLTKLILQDEMKDLQADDIAQRESYKNSTGGSTGEPAVYMQDRNYDINSSANYYIAQSWRGADPYDDVIVLWGAGRDTFEGQKPFKNKVSDFFRNRLEFNCYKMSEEDMRNIIKAINKHKPKLIKAYATSLFEIAKFAKKNNIHIEKQKAIHSSVGTMHDFMREEIEGVFQCKVFDHYGSREMGSIASECSAHDGLHIMMENTLVEVVNEDGHACQPGDQGEIVVTTLNNFSMPLIRYKIGDVSSMQEYKPCACGCSYPKLQEISGRTVEMLKTMADTIVMPEYFVCQIGGDRERDDIEKFQIVQKKVDEIVVKIVKKGEISEEHKLDIEDKIKAVMGEECKVFFEFVDDIPKTKTGKYLYVVSEI